MKAASEHPLRLALTAGFGGMLAIFLIAGVDAVRLLHHMRVENQVLRDASLERSRRLDSIRSYVLLSHSYLGDYLMDSDQARAREDIAQLRDTWSRMLSDVADYPTGTLEETVLMKRVRDMLEQHWRDVDRVTQWAQGNRRRTESEFYSDEILPMRTAVVEITTRVADVDARQLASAEAQIQREFEDMGRQLTVLLEVAIGSALLLAAGCVVYILKVERQNQRRYEEIVAGRGALEQLSARLVSAQEEERRAISRELHDEIGQTLTAVMVDAANLARRIPPEDTISRQYLDNIRGLADSSVNSIRNIALLLRPSMLDDLGLIPALEWQAREVSRRTGIKIKVLDQDVPEALPDAVRTCVYRVVQEALNNISRHSNARGAVINVRTDGDTLALTIEDDGSGFDPERSRGLGLLGMEERVKQLGGHLEVSSAPGKSTVLRVTLPIAVT
ncbi:MAG TPA: sensor histidine kinase [Bryobacteraceae bacterium]|nr:sensor histidine kinase [Bryobacteraceae bacterium]